MSKKVKLEKELTKKEAEDIISLFRELTDEQIVSYIEKNNLDLNQYPRYEGYDIKFHFMNLVIKFTFLFFADDNWLRIFKVLILQGADLGMKEQKRKITGTNVWEPAGQKMFTLLVHSVTYNHQRGGANFPNFYRAAIFARQHGHWKSELLEDEIMMDILETKRMEKKVLLRRIKRPPLPGSGTGGKPRYFSNDTLNEILKNEPTGCKICGLKIKL